MEAPPSPPPVVHGKIKPWTGRNKPSFSRRRPFRVLINLL